MQKRGGGKLKITGKMFWHFRSSCLKRAAEFRGWFCVGNCASFVANWHKLNGWNENLHKRNLFQRSKFLAMDILHMCYLFICDDFVGLIP